MEASKKKREPIGFHLLSLLSYGLYSLDEAASEAAQHDARGLSFLCTLRGTVLEPSSNPERLPPEVLSETFPSTPIKTNPPPPPQHSGRAYLFVSVRQRLIPVRSVAAAAAAEADLSPRSRRFFKKPAGGARREDSATSGETLEGNRWLPVRAPASR